MPLWWTSMRDLAVVLGGEVLGYLTPAPRPCSAARCQMTADVGLLCDRHLQELNRWLHDVENESRYVDAVPNTGKPDSPGGGGAPAFTRTPVRLDAVVLTDHRQGTGWAEDEDDRRAAGPTAPVLVVLRRWADRVREYWMLTPPSRPTVRTEQLLLTDHLDWCVRQPWIGRMHREIGTLRAALVRVNGGEDTRPLGECPTCRGPLMPDQARAVCGDNPAHSWSGADLARLALTIRKDALP